MPQALILIVAAITQEPSVIKRAVRDVAYYQKSNTKVYRSHRKKRLKSTASLTPLIESERLTCWECGDRFIPGKEMVS